MTTQHHPRPTRTLAVHAASLMLLLALGCGDDSGTAADASVGDASETLDARMGPDAPMDAAPDALRADDVGPALDAGDMDAGPREVSDEVRAWQSLFDIEWARALSFYTDESVGREVDGQRRYFDHRVTDGLIAMFQATGETRYIDDLIWYIDRVKSLAVRTDDGYYDWPIDGVNYQLFDGHGWRNVFKFLWLLKKHPELRAMSNYQEKYDEYLPWFTENLWEKWRSRGCNAIFRSQTHMASHMASNMALFLSLIEDDPTQKAEYLSYVEAWNDNMNGKCASAADPGIGFRDQLRVDGRHGGYVWAGGWGRTGTNDVPHSNAEVQSVIHQHQQGIGWTGDDLAMLITTLNAVLDASPEAGYGELPFRLDAIYDASDDNRGFIHYGWSMLGRYDEALQTRLGDVSPRLLKAGYVYNNFLGVMAYNQAYLDGYVVYEE